MGRSGRAHNVVRIFVSSPGDVVAEREAVAAVAEELNAGVAARHDLSVRIDRWEGFHPTADFRTQVEERLANADLFVMIFARRYGEASTVSDMPSGTREEFEIADRLRRASSRSGEPGRPDIFVYFLEIPEGDPIRRDRGPQFSQLMEFRAYLERNFFYQTYLSPETFSTLFRVNLTSWLFDYAARSEDPPHRLQRRESLTTFFALGSRPSPTTIIYPAREEHDKGYLLPWVTAEDFHAIRKITDCLRDTTSQKVRAWTDKQYERFCAEYDEGALVGNRVFICVFLNPPALEAIEEIGSQCGFKLLAGSDADRRQDRAIIWDVDGRQITVRSPLSGYLQAQERSEPQAVYTKDRVGVDFAVLARYAKGRAADKHQAQSTSFAFGLRSLGTWGAAWFLEHEIGRSAVVPEGDEPFERLLRVEYRGNGIADVRDVSGEDQHYFEQQCSEEFIAGWIG